MPATRKTRLQRKAAKEDDPKETEEEQQGDEKEEKRTRRGRVTRSAQQVTSKIKDESANDEEEDGSESRGVDDMSEDRSRSRRTRRGKHDKEVTATENNDEVDNENDDDESEFDEKTSKTGKRKSIHRNTSAKRSKTSTKDIASNEAESADAPPRTLKTRSMQAKTRKSQVSKEDFTVDGDTEDEAAQKDDEKSNKSESESDIEKLDSSRVTRASRTKTRKSHVNKEEITGDGDTEDEATQKEDEKSDKSESESDNEDLKSFRVTRASRSKTRKSHVNKEEITGDCDMEDEAAQKEDEQLNKNGSESENEDLKSSRVTRASRSKIRKSQADKEEITNNDDIKNVSDEKGNKQAENTGEGETSLASASEKEKNESSRSKKRNNQAAKDEIASNDDSKNVSDEKESKQAEKTGEGEASRESAPEKEKREYSETNTAPRPKVKAGRPRKKPDSQKQQDDKDKKQKSSKQLKLSDFLKSKDEVDAAKREDEGSRDEIKEKNFDENRILNKSPEEVEGHEDESVTSSKPPEGKEYTDQAKESPIEKETDSEDQGDGKEFEGGSSAVKENSDKEQASGEYDSQDTAAPLGKEKADEMDVEETPCVLDEKDKADDMDGEDTTTTVSDVKDKLGEIVVETTATVSVVKDEGDSMDAEQTTTMPDKGDKAGEIVVEEATTVSDVKDKAGEMDKDDAATVPGVKDKADDMRGEETTTMPDEGGKVGEIVVEEATTVSDMKDKGDSVDAQETTTVPDETDKSGEIVVEETTTVSDMKDKGDSVDAQETTTVPDGTDKAGEIVVEEATTVSDMKDKGDSVDAQETTTVPDETDKAGEIVVVESATLSDVKDEAGEMDAAETTIASDVKDNAEVMCAIETTTMLDVNDKGDSKPTGSLEESTEQLPIDKGKNSDNDFANAEKEKVHDDLEQLQRNKGDVVEKEEDDAKNAHERCVEDTCKHSNGVPAGSVDKDIVDSSGERNDSISKLETNDSPQFVPKPTDDETIDLRANDIQTKSDVIVIGETAPEATSGNVGSQEESKNTFIQPPYPTSTGYVNDIVVLSAEKILPAVVADTEQSLTTIHVGVRGPTEMTSVSVEIAPEVSSTSSARILQAQVTTEQELTLSATNEQVSQLKFNDIILPSADTADEKENKKRTMSDGDAMDEVMVKRQKMDGEEDAKEVEEPKKYINLRCIKMRLFSIGSRVHGEAGYERLFRDYWNSIALCLDSRIPMSYSKAYKKIIDRFLRTKSLRRLHNRLILGLIDRSLDETIAAQLVDLKGISEDIRARIRPVTRSRKQMQNLPTMIHKKLEMEFKSALSLSSISAQHAPLISCPSQVTIRPQKIIENSANIPGALVVDPFMRKNARSLGMMVSEHAIWLVTIAMKEYTRQLLRNLVTSSKLLNQGQVPPISVNRLTPSKRKGQEVPKAEDRPLPYDTSRAVQCLSAFDIHLFTAGMPIGPAGSLGGYASRNTYEKSLASCVGDGYTLSAFDDLKQFITSSFESSIFIRKVSDRRSPASVSPSSDRRSPYGGLGRGAKDLAALKARATQKNQQQPPLATLQRQESQNQEVKANQQQQPQSQPQIASQQQHQQYMAQQQQQQLSNQQQQYAPQQQQSASTQQKQPITDQRQQQQLYTAQQQQLQRQMMQQRLQQSQQQALAQPQQFIPTDSTQKGTTAANPSTPPKAVLQMQPSPPQLQPQPSQVMRQTSQTLPPSQVMRQTSQTLPPSQVMRQTSQTLPLQGQPLPSPQQFPQQVMQGQSMSPQQQMQMQLQMQQQMMQQQHQVQQQIQQRDSSGTMNAQAQKSPQQLQQQQMQMQMQQQMMQMQYMQAMQAQAQKQQQSTPSQPLATQPAPQSTSTQQQQQSSAPSSPQRSPSTQQRQPARPPSVTGGGKGFGIKNLKAMLARNAPPPEDDASNRPHTEAPEEKKDTSSNHPPTQSDEDQPTT